MGGWKEGWIDSCMSRLITEWITNEWMEGQNNQIDKWMDAQMDEWQVVGKIDGWMDGWWRDVQIDRNMHNWWMTDGWFIDGWTDRRMDNPHCFSEMDINNCDLLKMSHVKNNREAMPLMCVTAAPWEPLYLNKPPFSSSEAKKWLCS